MRTMIAEVEAISADPARDASARRLAGRCLELCLRTQAANDDDRGPLLTREVNELLALVRKLQANGRPA